MSSLEKTALRCLGGFINGIVIIDEANEVLVNTAGGSPEELRALKNCFGDREAAVKSGVNLAGSRYEVHKHYPDHNPPMVYGRTMHPKEDPLNSSGFGIIKNNSGPTGRPTYIMVTYVMPNISARVLPEVIKFAAEHL